MYLLLYELFGLFDLRGLCEIHLGIFPYLIFRGSSQSEGILGCF